MKKTWKNKKDAAGETPAASFPQLLSAAVALVAGLAGILVGILVLVLVGVLVLVAVLVLGVLVIHEVFLLYDCPSGAWTYCGPAAAKYASRLLKKEINNC